MVGRSSFDFDFDSMWPLLKKDGLGVQYIATLLLWNRLIGYNPVRLWPRSFIQFLSMVSTIFFAIFLYFPKVQTSRLSTPRFYVCI